MPRRSDTSDLTCALDANPVLDKDHVYFSDQGWAYRHFKNEAKTEYWDEILVAGQALEDDGTPDATADTFGDASVTFLNGDGAQFPALTIAPVTIVPFPAAVQGTDTNLSVIYDGSVADAVFSWSTDEASATFDDNTLETPVLTHHTAAGTYTLTVQITSATATDSPVTATFAYEVTA